MKKYNLFYLLAVLGGAVGFLLRLLQNRTGFEAETGLPVSGNLPALALIVLLKIIPHPLYDYLYYPVRCLLGISIIATVILAMEWMERTLPALNALLWAILSWFGGLTLELYLLHQSYLILFEFPYTLLTYPSAAFCLPTMTAALIYLYRCRRRKEKAT